jgi:hypothetical protein
MSMAATTSGVIETQALFSSTPITLGVGDFIEMKATFVNTAGINNSGSAQLAFGMFNSGGSAPKNNLSTSGLTSSLSTDASGGAADWKGYSVQLFVTSGSNARFLSRANQTAGDNTNQDALTSNASASTSYHNPAGTSLASLGAADVTLTAGATYTEDLKYTLTGSGTYSLSSVLTDATNTAVSTFNVASVSPANLITSFDSLAIGWRETANVVSTMDISSIIISTSVSAVPEVSAFFMVGLVGAGWLTIRSIRTRKTRKEGGVAEKGPVQMADAG